ncbi:hypothetical protein [Tahibacter sp.]|uniref:hypothetical protein n=1 Tax=Tahibacter sp. TaxID=2056211 RepID=UPI0028C3DABA|nr:hypothetical protein [Tahibacter sp.]
MYQDLLVYCRDPARWPDVLAYARCLLTPGAGLIVRLHDDSSSDSEVCAAPLEGGVLLTEVARGAPSLTEALVQHSAWTDAVLIDGLDDLTVWRSVVCDSARPCLVLPAHDRAEPPPPRHIGLGWNGSLQCRRALHAALPLLQDATRVVMFQAGGHAADADAACAYLGRHGVGTLRIDSTAAPADACAHLTELSRRHELDLLVLGAFPHVRFSEWDGATTLARLLRSADMPLLLAH